MFWQLLLITVATWMFYYRWQRRRLYKIVKAIPSSFQSYPVVGHAYLFRGNDEDRMRVFQIAGREAFKKDGLTSMWMMNTLYVNVADPMAAETIGKACVQKDEKTIKFFRTVIGNGSIFAPVNIWRPRRKILAPIFNLKNMRQFVTVFNKQSTIMTKLLGPMSETGDFSIWKYITAYTFDAVCETTLDIEMNAQSKPAVPFLKAFDLLLSLIAQRCNKPWLYPDFIYKKLARYKEFIENRQLVWDFVDEVIQRKRREHKTREQEGNETSGVKTFLEMMIEQSGKGNTVYTDLELREEAMVIILAGTDTSAVGASFTTVMLSRYPEVQEKVYQELQDVFGNSDRPVTAEDLSNLKYLEAVIKESLRLYPPVPLITKEIEEDVELPSGITLVRDTKVVINIWAIHRNPRYWGEDAEQFRPERFLEAPLAHPSQYLPFSQFSRNCLGLIYAMNSMKTVMANLFRRYKVLPPQNMDPTTIKEPLRVKFNIMMKHVNDYIVRLVKRE